MKRRITLLTVLTLLLLSAALTACSGGEASGAAHNGLKMAPISAMPEDVKRASTTVQDAYRFNVANPEIMQEIPCYCGCGGMGHKSNYACYVQQDNGGDITFDTHALGCSICVDITLDTMRMMQEGKTVAEIQQAVDDTYAQYGPPNNE